MVNWWVGLDRGRKRGEEKVGRLQWAPNLKKAVQPKPDINKPVPTKKGNEMKYKRLHFQPPPVRRVRKWKLVDESTLWQGYCTKYRYQCRKRAKRLQWTTGTYRRLLFPFKFAKFGRVCCFVVVTLVKGTWWRARCLFAKLVWSTYLLQIQFWDI